VGRVGGAGALVVSVKSSRQRRYCLRLFAPPPVSRLAKEDRLPHLLLHGPPGTGKTSTVLALSRQLYGEKGAKTMTLELNASDERGIDVVRTQIVDFASTQRIFSTGFKLVVLDECDAMTKDAQFALRRVIEKFTKSTRFCLICNAVNKVIPALQSRCTRFRFAPLPAPLVVQRLKDICCAEKCAKCRVPAAAAAIRCSGSVCMCANQLTRVPTTPFSTSVKATDEALGALQALSGGDMRRSLNLLQSTWLAQREVGAHCAGEAISADDVYTTAGQPRPADVEAVAHALLNSPFSAALHALRTLQGARGVALGDVTRALLPWVMRLHVDSAHKAALVEALADVEARLAYVTGDKVQQAAVVGAFAGVRAQVVLAAKA
jgi:replication factor C subunit 3/5